MNHNWTRADLKRRAKECLKIYYWPAFFVSLISFLINGSMGEAGGSRATSSGGSNGDFTAGLTNPELMGFLLVFFSILGIVLLISLIVEIFLGNVISVGSCRFFMESRINRRSAGVGRIFWGFSCGHYFNIVKVMFLVSIKVLLWSLLFVIPGIIKSYEYQMVPYILSENPGMPSREAFARSRDMMYGNKWAVFVLDLSFLGWILLAGAAAMLLESLTILNFISFGMVSLLPVCFVMPYLSATRAELYGYLRNI